MEKKTQVSRRALLAAGGTLAAAGWAGSPAYAQGGRISGRGLVRGGVADAVIVHADDAGPTVVTAVAELRDHIAEVTGVELPIGTLPGNPPTDGLSPIYVGLLGRESDPGLSEAVGGLEPDGFVLDPHGRSLTIIGGSEWGTLNGVYAFLEQFAGVTWLMPGPVGVHAPPATTIHRPVERVVGVPGFAQRMMSPMVDNPAVASGMSQTLSRWAQRNRLQGKHNQAIAFHHNLHTLFPVSEFGESHPEYYANSTPPPPGTTAYWQPAFSVPETIDVAVGKINNFFVANPQARSFSLGVNDGGGFAEADPVAAYYGWVNEVVGRVTEDHPDKWFGLLAYVELETPPNFPLHAKVVPFFTQDRFAWADPAVEAASKARLNQWGQVASNLGFYDYTYGSPYVLPRVTPHLSARTYAYADASGVIGHYEEIYANWAEGPKPWVNARLMWDPTADVDSLLTYWYDSAVGPAAAPHLQSFYALWEDFWTNDAIGSAWFKPQATYQAFNSAGYVEALPPAKLSEARSHMDAVLGHPGSPAQQERATKLERGFDYYEASARAYPRAVSVLPDSAAALALLGEIEGAWASRRDAAADRKAMLVEFEADPILRQPLNAFNYGLAWTGWNRDEFWRLADFLADHEPSGGSVTTWLEDRQTASTLFGEFCRLLTGVSARSITSSVVNGSFESGNQAWFLWVASTGTLTVTAPAARTGSAGLAASRITRGGPAQTFAVTPGLLVTRAWIRVGSSPQSHRGTVQFNINLQSAAGTQVGVIRSTETRLSDHTGWFAVDSLDEVPATVAGTPVAKVQYVLVLDNMAGDPEIAIDDVVAFQAP